LFTQKKPHHLSPRKEKNCKYIIKIDRKTQEKAQKREKELLRKTYVTKNKLQNPKQPKLPHSQLEHWWVLVHSVWENVNFLVGSMEPRNFSFLKKFLPNRYPQKA
jgi:hypothetical protein